MLFLLNPVQMMADFFKFLWEVLHYPYQYMITNTKFSCSFCN